MLVALAVRELIQGTFPDTRNLAPSWTIPGNNIKLERNTGMCRMRYEAQHPGQAIPVCWYIIRIVVFLHLNKVEYL